MTYLIISPLARIAELAVRHKAQEMISLLAKGQDFHRPAVIRQDRHLLLGLNDITFAGSGDLVAPDEAHVQAIIDFARTWDPAAPLLIHCWMGVSRSPAAAIIAALARAPEQDDDALALRLRRASAFATPNARMIDIADHLLHRNGRLTRAIKALGRGADADGNAPFVFSIQGDPSTGR
ncbi:MAG: hypothetical protein RIR97_2169 [Pseudomonadota bacterium]